MSTENKRSDIQTPPNNNTVNITESVNKDDQNKSANTSGDPGRTPGSAEGDEATVDEDIREKEVEGKL